jgi:hypothetical protein
VEIKKIRPLQFPQVSDLRSDPVSGKEGKHDATEGETVAAQLPAPYCATGP